jgi:hypothetical protein
MKRLFSVAAITSLLLTMASISWATQVSNETSRNRGGSVNMNSSTSSNRTEQKAACIEKATTDQAKAACEKTFAKQANKKGEVTTIAPGKTAPLPEPKRK